LGRTEKTVIQNHKVKLAIDTKDILGYKDYQGTGFVIEGTAKYLELG
jgi:hypothetical protein